MIRFTRPGPHSGKHDRFHPETFDLLGFTHYWGKSRKKNWVIKRKTASDRFTRSVRNISEWCRKNRHMEILEQHNKLVGKINGHYQHFGITGNSKALKRYLYEVRRIWRKWLDRRSQKERMPWMLSEAPEEIPLPEP